MWMLIYKVLPSMGYTRFKASALIDTSPKAFAALLKLKEELEGWKVAIKEEHGVVTIEITEASGGRESALRLVAMKEKSGGGTTSVVEMDGERKNIGWSFRRRKGGQGGGKEFIGFTLLDYAYGTFRCPAIIDGENVRRLAMRLTRGGEEYSTSESGMLQRFEESECQKIHWVVKKRAAFDQNVAVWRSPEGVMRFDFNVDGNVWDVMAFDFLDNLRVRENEIAAKGGSRLTKVINQHSRVTTMMLGRKKWVVKARWKVTKGGVGKIFREGGDCAPQSSRSSQSPRSMPLATI